MSQVKAARPSKLTVKHAYPSGSALDLVVAVAPSYVNVLDEHETRCTERIAKLPSDSKTNIFLVAIIKNRTKSQTLG